MVRLGGCTVESRTNRTEARRERRLKTFNEDVAEALTAFTSQCYEPTRATPGGNSYVTQRLSAKKCGVVLAASPGTSRHERAIAIDIENHGNWIEVLKKHNWIWRGQADPPHFNYHGGGDPDFGHKGITAFQKLWNLHNPNDKIDEDGSYGDDTQKRLEASPIEGF
jgi:hypothetical protein